MDSIPVTKSGRLWKSKADFFRPFRTAAAEAGENIIPLYDPSLRKEEVPEPNLRELNSALEALVDIFPDVEPEVFREMLTSVSEESRLQVVTEHLLQKKAKWVRGRYRVKQESQKRKKVASKDAVAKEDLFRDEAYRKAVKQVFYLEFRSLSHSTIRGVLAENNFSYSLARPILQQVASRGWRFSLSGLWSKRNAADNHPFVIWSEEGAEGNRGTPAVKRTGSSELDHELYELFVAPIVNRQREDRLRTDFEAASKVNETQAEEYEALFDCECCYSSVTFERIATCDTDCHYLCFDCIRRTANEALYGQGWARAADLRRTTIRCFAPSSQDCEGCLPSELVRRSLSQGTENEDMWHEFQARITTETLLKSGLPLQKCPFCSYAEVNDVPQSKIKHPLAIWAHITTKATPATQAIFLLSFLAATIFTAPLLLLAIVFYLLDHLLPPKRSPLERSIKRVYTTRRGLKFRCLNPSCLATTCMRCTSVWTDPHSCFDSEKTSLRTAIETSATAAVKRTCPRCMLSFVKSSGCNKLVCNCGYTMCYICRQEITSKEGYAHFCQHFRPNGGRCGECERCDLYGDEDEEAAIRRAAEEAEKIWKEKEGGKEGDEAATKRMIDALVGEGRKEWWDDWLDPIVDAILQ